MDNLTERIENLSPDKRALLEKLQREASAPEAVVPHHSEADSFPLSFAQQRLYFLNQLEGDSSAYNIPRAFRLFGSLNVDALSRAFASIIARHGSLRTIFVEQDGVPLQKILDRIDSPLILIDLNSFPVTARETEVLRLAKTEAEQPFDLAHGPLLRATLLRLSEIEHVLLLTMHHIVSDAWSASVLFRELAEFYKHDGANLPELAIQYADYAVWQRKYLTGEVLDHQLNYWTQQLAEPSVLELPADRPRPPLQSSRGSECSLMLSHELAGALNELARAHNATLFMTLLAAFQTLLYRYSGQQDICVGSPVANRDRDEVEPLIGFFINTLVFRTDLSGEPAFATLLQRVRKVALDAYSHRDLPFEKLVEELQPQRSLSYSPLFQVMLILQNTPSRSLHLAGLKVEPLRLETETAKFDLTLGVGEHEAGLHCVLEYNADLFDRDTATGILDHFRVLLESIVADPQTRISELNILPEAERDLILKRWNETSAPYDDHACLHQVFEHQVRQTPDAVALRHNDRSITYAELNERANKFGWLLVERGVKPETVVGICMERSIDMVVGLLGILKAGGAYLPLDPAYPSARLRYMTHDAELTLLLTEARFADKFENTGAQLLSREGLQAELDATKGEALNVEVTAENLAYIMYTSGSTGQPKGVEALHRSTLNRFSWMWRSYPFAAGEVCCQKTALSFVDSVWEIFGPLLQGVPNVIIPDEVLKDPESLVQTLAVNRVSRLVLVPSLLRVLLESVADLGTQLPSLKLWITSGEALSPQLAQEFALKLPNSVLLNLYGSSEVAADVTCAEVNSGQEGSLGRPIANTEIYILDCRMQPAPIGVPGDLYVGGANLARGYYKRPHLTAEKFVANPFARLAGQRLYQTGDIARYRTDGNIEYRGRSDSQIKLRGFRIELGEIESALKEHPAVRECVVVLRQDVNGPALAAYCTNTSSAMDVRELRTYLSQRLPEHMVPAVFISLERMPLLPNGKIDRTALPTPSAASESSKAEADQLQHTPVEEIVAGIWSKVLSVDHVGVHDNFFGLGGHSLLAIQVVARLKSIFKVELPLKAFFNQPTVSGVAARVEAALRGGEPLTLRALAPVARNGNLPLSFTQQRAWFLHELDPANASYHIRRLIKIDGPLNEDLLFQALRLVVERHESLRTTFPSADGIPIQEISTSLDLNVRLTDLEALVATEQEAEVRRLVQLDADLPFDLSKGPLLRVKLLRLSPADHSLLVTMHHIITDGWSMAIFFRELKTIYGALSRNEDLSLPPLSIQFADYAFWQRENWRGEVREEQLRYWKQKLAGAPSLLRLPTDRPRTAERDSAGAQVEFAISPETTNELYALVRRQNVTLYIFLLSGFKVLLSYYSKERDVVVGSPVANRDDVQLEGVIGPFINTLALRTSLTGDPGFTELLERVKETALGAYAHPETPFEALVDELQLPRNLNHNPLFQVWFVLQNWQSSQSDPAELKFSGLPIDDLRLRHDLQLTMWQDRDLLRGAFEYSTALFDHATISAVSEDFRFILETATAQPEVTLSQLEALLTQRAQQKRVTKGGPPARPSGPAGTRRKPINIAQSGQISVRQLRHESSLPLLIKPAAAELNVFDWLSDNREWVKSRLLTHGAILFRDFNLATPEDFEKFISILSTELLDYSYRSTPRTHLSGKVYSSTEYPAHQSIPLHNELAYARSWPMKLGFFCVQRAAQGGQTPIADSRRVYQAIAADIREEFARKGVMYVRNYGEGLDLSWQDVFQTDEKTEVEHFCKQHDIAFTWNDGERLTTRKLCQAVSTHPVTGDKVWFNQAHLFHISSLAPEIRESLRSACSEEQLPRNAFYGDGSRIDDAVLEEIRACYRRETIEFDWQNGDVLIVDNMLTAHGRNPYSGFRKIVVAMAEQFGSSTAF